MRITAPTMRSEAIAWSITRSTSTARAGEFASSFIFDFLRRLSRKPCLIDTLARIKVYRNHEGEIPGARLLPVSRLTLFMGRYIKWRMFWHAIKEIIPLVCMLFLILTTLVFAQQLAKVSSLILSFESSAEVSR